MTDREKDALTKALNEFLAKEITRKRSRKQASKAFGLSEDELKAIEEMEGATWTPEEYARMEENARKYAPDSEHMKSLRKKYPMVRF